jgi:putative CocE/NonD family hydrolase
VIVPLLAPLEAAAAECTPQGTTIDRFVPFMNRFGEKIAVDLYVPAGRDGRPLTSAGCSFPVILESSPYRDWTTPQPTKPTEDDRRVWWVKRGYIYAFADVPGTGGSDGSWCLFCIHEQLSGYDMVEAMGTMPGSDGNVGMIGGSYPGITTLMIAQHRPPHLRAIITVAFLLDLYEDFFFVGGMRRLEDTAVITGAYTYFSHTTGQWEVPTSAGDAARAAQVFASRPQREPVNFLAIQDQHPYYDDFWAERRIVPEQVTVPIYMVGGWNDIFDDPVWRAYDRIGSQVKVIRQGPFTHAPLWMPPGAWPCADATGSCGEAFFDRHLKGLGSSAYDDLVIHPVQYYIQPAGYTAANRYVRSARKPYVDDWSFPLGPAGATATLRWDPAAGATSSRWFARGSVPGSYPPPYEYYLGFDGGQDQRVEEKAAVSYATPPLTKGTTLIGPTAVSLVVTSDATDADVVVRIVDEFPPEPGVNSFPAGYGYAVTSGWLRASHRNGHGAEDMEPLEPGRPTRLDVHVWPTGYRFAKGHRIRVDILPADTPRFAPQTKPYNLTIDLGASSVVLPRA